MDDFIRRYGGEYLDGSGFESEPPDAPEAADNYSREEAHGSCLAGTTARS